MSTSTRLGIALAVFGLAGIGAVLVAARDGHHNILPALQVPAAPPAPLVPAAPTQQPQPGTAADAAAEAGPATSSPLEGRTFSLYHEGVGGGGGAIPMALKDAGDLVKWEQTIGSHDSTESTDNVAPTDNKYAEDELRLSGRIMALQRLTNVKVLSVNGYVANVEVLSGINAGAKGMVSVGTLWDSDGRNMFPAGSR